MTLIVMMALCIHPNSALLHPLIQTALATEVESNGISIDKTYLMTGNALEVDNPHGYSLRYYVDDEQIQCDALTLSSDYYEKWITVKAYNDDEEFIAEDRAYFSKLPVLYINTDDGTGITSKTEYKDATMFIQGNSTSASAIYNGKITIKGRGNSTWGMPKKPYRIKLDKKTDLFGMGKNKNWVLLANYLDESLLRNTTAFQVSNELGLETMNSVWTDVILNGEYVGNYQLCEQIRVDEVRIDIFDWESEAENVASAVYKQHKESMSKDDKDALEDFLKENLSWITSGEFTFQDVTYQVADYYTIADDISGGYLFELSNEYDEISKFMTDNGLKVMIKSPEYLNTNPDMLAYVIECWQRFENAYMSEDGYVDVQGERVHYTELADLNSMISYWLVMEILGNNDAVYKSRYAYMDVREPLFFGPVWDFDWGCGSSAVGSTATGWKMSLSSNQQNFYREFLDDPLFVSKASEKYWEIRPFLESLIEDGGWLDEQITYLNESGIADQARQDKNMADQSKRISNGYQYVQNLLADKNRMA